MEVLLGRAHRVTSEAVPNGNDFFAPQVDRSRGPHRDLYPGLLNVTVLLQRQLWLYQFVLDESRIGPKARFRIEQQTDGYEIPSSKDSNHLLAFAVCRINAGTEGRIFSRRAGIGRYGANANPEAICRG